MTTLESCSHLWTVLESQELTFSSSTIRSLKTRSLRHSSRSTGKDLDLDFKFWSLDFGFGLGLLCRDELVDYYTPVGWSEVLLETRRDNTESNLGNLITGFYKLGRCYLSFLCTDSMVQFNKWDDINIAFINDGGIR